MEITLIVLAILLAGGLLVGAAMYNPGRHGRES